MEGFAMFPTLRTKTGNFPSLVDAFFGDDFLSNFFENQNMGTVPAVNILETKEDFAIELAAPGLEKKDFKVDVHNNVLTISCEKEMKNEVENEKIMRREFSYSAFKRSFTLPDSAESEKIKATYKEGILKINIPKREEAKEKPARQISIS
jgi:HSP20 family protein